MDPLEKERIGGKDKHPDKNLLFRALEGDFNEAARPDIRTALGKVLRIPGEVTSAGEGPTLYFLQQL